MQKERKNSMFNYSTLNFQPNYPQSCRNSESKRINFDYCLNNKSNFNLKTDLDIQNNFYLGNSIDTLSCQFNFELLRFKVNQINKLVTNITKDSIKPPPAYHSNKSNFNLNNKSKINNDGNHSSILKLNKEKKHLAFVNKESKKEEKLTNEEISTVNFTIKGQNAIFNSNYNQYKEHNLRYKSKLAEKEVAVDNNDNSNNNNNNNSNNHFKVKLNKRSNDLNFMEYIKPCVIKQKTFSFKNLLDNVTKDLEYYYEDESELEELVNVTNDNIISKKFSFNAKLQERDLKKICRHLKQKSLSSVDFRKLKICNYSVNNNKKNKEEEEKEMPLNGGNYFKNEFLNFKT